MGLGRRRASVKRGSTGRGPCYIRLMRDRVFFPLCALIALGMIALALLWPRGMGAVEPSLSHPIPSAVSGPAK